eukprot:UC1_evm2s726
MANDPRSGSPEDTGLGSIQKARTLSALEMFTVEEKGSSLTSGVTMRALDEEIVEESDFFVVTTGAEAGVVKEVSGSDGGRSSGDISLTTDSSSDSGEEERVGNDRKKRDTRDSGELLAELRKMKQSTGSRATLRDSQKMGYLMKYGNMVKGFRRRHFSLVEGTLFYAKSADDPVRTELDVRHCSVAERSDKNLSNGFEVITQVKKLVLQAESRQEMEAWIGAFKGAATAEPLSQRLDNDHSLFFHRSKRTTFCNVCGKAIPRQTKCLRCEICGFRAHHGCATHTNTRCKWTTINTVPHQCRTEDGIFGHQWITGNSPGSSKCLVCNKPVSAKTVVKDYRCMWCRATVHSFCRIGVDTRCTLGALKVSILPPTAISRRPVPAYGDSLLRAPSPWVVNLPSNCSPIVVFFNPKSGSNDGVVMGRILRNLLNPAQIFDLSQGGPANGLKLLSDLRSFRALACGGDGTVGWILQEADHLDITGLQLGVMPLGTGNDLAGVLGWGHSFSDTDKVLAYIDGIEKAKVTLLDRWSLRVSPLTEGIASEFAFGESDNSAGPSAAASANVSRRGSRELDSGSGSGGSGSDKAAFDTTTISSIGSLAIGGTDGTDGGGSGTDTSATTTTADDTTSTSSTTTASSHPPPSSFQAQELGLAQGGKHLRIKSVRRQNPLSAVKVRQRTTSSTSALEALGEDIYSDASESGEEEGSGPDDGPLSPRSTGTMEESDFATAFDFDIAMVAGDDTVSSKQNGGKMAARPRRRSSSVALPREAVDLIHARLDEVNRVGHELSDTCKALVLAVGAVPIPALAKPLPVLADELVLAYNRMQETVQTHAQVTTQNSQSRLMAACEAASRLAHEAVDVSEAWPASSANTTTGTTTDAAASGSTDIADNSAVEDILTRRLTALERDVMVLTGAATSVVMAHQPSVQQLPRVRQSLGAVQVLGPDGGGTMLSTGEEISVMNNYFGIGLDAKVAFDFDQLRREHPEKCRSRIKNQMWYAIYGAKQSVVNDFKNLHRRITVRCDGVPIKLPKCQGVIILNIPSFMGGVNLWGTPSESKFRPQRMDDGLLEVMAVRNSAEFGLAKTSMGAITPTRLCQARSVSITINGPDPLPIQVDGEAWMQAPCVLNMVHKGRCQLLSRDKDFQKMLQNWPTHRPGEPREANDILTTFDDAASALLSRLGKLAAKLPPPSSGPGWSDLHHSALQSRNNVYPGKSGTARVFERRKVLHYIFRVTRIVETLQLTYNLPRARAPFLVSATDVESKGESSLRKVVKKKDEDFGASLRACDAQLTRVLNFVPQSALLQFNRGSFIKRLKGRLTGSLSIRRDSSGNSGESAGASPRTSPKPARKVQAKLSEAKLDTMRNLNFNGDEPGLAAPGEEQPSTEVSDGTSGTRRTKKTAMSDALAGLPAPDMPTDAGAGTVDTLSGLGTVSSLGEIRRTPEAVEECASFLSDNGLGHHADTFRARKITKWDLMDLSIDELADLGVSNQGEQRHFSACLESLEGDLFPDGTNPGDVSTVASTA